MEAIHIGEEEVNDNWLHGMRGSDILKGGVGSGIKGHRTLHTKGERISYAAEKARWMKEKLTPEQKKQLEDIKKIEQDLAEKRKELSVTVDHDIWVDSVKDSRAKLKQIKRDLRSLPSKARKVSNFEIEEAEYNFLHARPDMMNATGLELVRIKNKYSPDEQEGPPETWIKYNKKTQEELKEKDEENILALHKDADITEIVLFKGGKGSGIKGHRTETHIVGMDGVPEQVTESVKRLFNKLPIFFKENILRINVRDSSSPTASGSWEGIRMSMTTFDSSLLHRTGRLSKVINHEAGHSAFMRLEKMGKDGRLGNILEDFRKAGNIEGGATKYSKTFLGKTPFHTENFAEISGLLFSDNSKDKEELKKILKDNPRTLKAFRQILDYTGGT